MNNKKKYMDIFVKCFNVKEEDVENLAYKNCVVWDSVGHINLIDGVEEAFEIIMEPDDIIDFDSFKKGMRILSEKYNVEF